ncbi:hypothetical protein [Nesterenkonia haasae]|uniref:hypothetical protein n=1 Tax=Nesterenkonia haasae TaxID=2587813 RepID=UPI001390B675|nr:hypothetical protein [Nesterenkonia haasae]NDK31789.1 hypothetical protein [Nesterenkonia haasae]
MSRSATTTSQPVLNAARQLADTSTQAGTNLEDAIRILRAVWPQPRIPTRESDTHLESATGDTSENHAQVPPPTHLALDGERSTGYLPGVEAN